MIAARTEITFSAILLTLVFILLSIFVYYVSSALRGLNLVAYHGLNHDTHPALHAHYHIGSAAYIKFYQLIHCRFIRIFFLVFLARCLNYSCGILYTTPRLRPSILCAAYILTGSSRLSCSRAWPILSMNFLLVFQRLASPNPRGFDGLCTLQGFYLSY